MKVLIVEDDHDIRNGLADLLRKQGYDVVEAADGDAGLARFREAKPDFVCLDIMMPKRTGYDLCRAIRHIDQDVPLMFITAKAEELDKVLGLELGADDYILKPFGVHEVLARIRALTRRVFREQRRTATAPFTIGDLRIEPSELRAVRGESGIELTLRELSLLELFARNPGKVLDRDTLLDHGWGSAYVPNSRTLDQHISTLRKKIERDPKQPLIIQTVHGAGYRYNGEPARY